MENNNFQQKGYNGNNNVVTTVNKNFSMIEKFKDAKKPLLIVGGVVVVAGAAIYLAKKFFGKKKSSKEEKSPEKDKKD